MRPGRTAVTEDEAFLRFHALRCGEEGNALPPADSQRLLSFLATISEFSVSIAELKSLDRIGLEQIERIDGFFATLDACRSLLAREGLFYPPFEAQRLAGRLAALLWLPLVVLSMRFVLRWRIRDAGRCRREYARLLEERRPLLVVANHLTMVDSAVIGWGLGGVAAHALRHRGLPWNVPLQRRVESSWLWRALAYVTKCVPVPRGGDRQEVAHVLERLAHLLRSGETVLMFPESGRSRTGRVDPEAAVETIAKQIKGLEAKMEEVKNKRQEMATAFENFDQKTNQLFNILSTVMKTMKEMQSGLARNIV